VVSATPPDAHPRNTDVIAFVFGAGALGALLLSVFVMASRPWGCSITSDGSVVVTCDWVTSRVIAAVWLAAGLAVCLIVWKRRRLLLAIISTPLIAVSLISVIGVFTLAPAALWFACALWLWAQGHRLTIVLSGMASVVLLYLSTTGVLALLTLHSTPV
jgi:hypothetical protein